MCNEVIPSVRDELVPVTSSEAQLCAWLCIQPFAVDTDSWAAQILQVQVKYFVIPSFVARNEETRQSCLRDKLWY